MKKLSSAFFSLLPFIPSAFYPFCLLSPLPFIPSAFYPLCLLSLLPFIPSANIQSPPAITITFEIIF